MCIRDSRKDIPRKYRIDIETDSTIYAEAAQEKQNAVEFIEAFTKFLGSAEQITEKLPEAMPLMGKMLQFGVRKFRTGRDLESAIDIFITKMEKKSADLIANPPPNPEMMKMQSEKVKQQGEMQKQQFEAKAQADNDQRAMQIHQQESQTAAHNIQMETQKEMMSAKIEAQLEERRLQMEMAKMDRQEQLDIAKHNREMQKLRESESKKDGSSNS